MKLASNNDFIGNVSNYLMNLGFNHSMKLA
jgi:hypothetical protein